MLKSLKSLKAFKTFHSWKRFERFERAEPNATRRSPACRTGRDRTVLTRGFTLLETIVAFAVIFAALIGPVSLITRGLIDVTFAKNKLVALNLAQEGIELVRLTRDNNVLCDYLNGVVVRDFGQNPDSSPQYLYDNPQPRKADALNLESISCGAETLESPDFTGGSGAAVIRFYTGGSYADFYGHAGAGGPSVETQFSRKIRIEGVDVGSGVYAMKITSTVEWTERGLARTVILKDVLYNWR